LGWPPLLKPSIVVAQCDDLMSFHGAVLGVGSLIAEAQLIAGVINP